MIYSDIDKRPRECFVWRCRWLKSDEGTLDQPRPDRSGYVIDESPEFIDAMVSMIRDGQWVHVAARSSVTHNIEEILDVWTKEGMQI